MSEKIVVLAADCLHSETLLRAECNDYFLLASSSRKVLVSRDCRILMGC